MQGQDGHFDILMGDRGTSLKSPGGTQIPTVHFPKRHMLVGGIQHIEDLTIGRKDREDTDSISFARRPRSAPLDQAIPLS